MRHLTSQLTPKAPISRVGAGIGCRVAGPIRPGLLLPPTLPLRSVIARAATADEKAAEKAAKRLEKEKAGLEAFLAQGTPSVDSAVALLKEAMRTKSVPPPLVLGAAKWIENQGLPVDMTQVRGTYHLVFSTVTPIEAWNYIPVDEYIAITEDTISMWSVIGPLKTSFSGGFKVVSGQTMDYAMPRMTIKLFGNTVMEKMREQTESKKRAYSYFYVDSQLAVVRSSAGGITILYKP